MISHGEGFVLRHRSGRYIEHRIHIEADSAGCHIPGVPIAKLWSLGSSPFAAYLFNQREQCARGVLDKPEWQSVADQFEVVPGPGCGCCGQRWGTMWGDAGHWRCDKHKDRNPCAIEGCRCTNDRAGHAFRDDQYLCQKHWRPLTTPAERRVYSRIWRQAKARERKYGAEHMWPMREIGRLKRVWGRIVAKARARAEGDLDMDEINKMFGWDDAA